MSFIHIDNKITGGFAFENSDGVNLLLGGVILFYMWVVLSLVVLACLSSGGGFVSAPKFY